MRAAVHVRMCAPAAERESDRARREDGAGSAREPGRRPGRAEATMAMHRIAILFHILMAVSDVSATTKTNSNTVIVGNARFTVLTDSLIRMEAGSFNDVPSLVFQTREHVPAVDFTTERSAGGGVVITTKHVRLDFHPGANFSGFTAANLAVEFDLNVTHRGTWAPGMKDTQNLKGTLSSMDCYDDPATCASQARGKIGSGLISRAGWVVIDDTQTPLWAPESTDSVTSHWPWWRSVSSSGSSKPSSMCKTPAPQPASKPWEILNNTDWKANNCPNPYAESSGIEECADMCAARCDCVAVSAFKKSPNGGKSASSCNFKCKSSGAVANDNLNAVVVRPNAERCSEVFRSSDQYLFAHGRRYTDALRDFALVAGPMDMPPLSAFGIWWSRYWVYSVGVPSIAQDIVTDVLEGYRDHALPLNHLVMDMDWHSRSSQYSWNTSIIPDPAGWMADLHSGKNPLGHPLKYLVNLHPNGVGNSETHYKQFASIMGSHGKSSGGSYKCDLSDPAFASAYFDWMMGSAGLPAAPNNQIDFWWTDWGGCGSPGGGISPLWWGNYLYHQDAARTADGKRGLVLSRHGGLGTHRYGVGFSGDSPQHWDTLQVQVEMTPQVLFGYWSHDIGGFHNGTWMKGFGPFKNRTTGWMDEPGDEDPLDAKANELYLRWLQFATFSPIFRTHCQLEPIPVGNICDPRINPHCQGCERRIWKFIHHYPRMKDAMVLRNGLGPYIYTAVRKAYDVGVGLLRPMYYSFPEDEESYAFQATQYMFGDEMLIAPITEAAPAPVNATVTKSVWLPEGTWTDWHGEKTYVGPLVLNQSYSHADVPVFVRASAVFPLKTMGDVATPSPSTVIWVLFPAASSTSSVLEHASSSVGRGEMYEDDGESIAAKGDTPGGAHSAVTSVTWVGSCAAGERLEVTISSKGTHHMMVSGRKHALQLRGCRVPPRTATVNGQDIGAMVTSVGVVAAENAGEGANFTIIESSGELGWMLSPPRDSSSRSLVTGSEAIHVGLGQHATSAVVRVQVDF